MPAASQHRSSVLMPCRAGSGYKRRAVDPFLTGIPRHEISCSQEESLPSHQMTAFLLWLLLVAFFFFFPPPNLPHLRFNRASERAFRCFSSLDLKAADRNAVRGGEEEARKMDPAAVPRGWPLHPDGAEAREHWAASPRADGSSYCSQAELLPVESIPDPSGLLHSRNVPHKIVFNWCYLRH